jgi:ornithine carbamoyltransferase
MKKDLLSVNDLEREEVLEIWELAKRLKKEPVKDLLKGKVFALLFEKPSTRTRISFEAGITQLGGSSIYIDATTTQLSRGETIEDTARTMERYVDMVIARVYSHETLIRMAINMNKPVINALSDVEHPCQALSDYFTIMEKFGKVEGVKVAYVGDGNNVCNSLLLAGAMMGAYVSVAGPRRYWPNTAIVDMAKKLGGDRIRVLESPEEAVKDADVVYTDVFISMGDEREREERFKAFLPRYRVTKGLMELASDRAIFMHCLPAHRGEEVEEEVIDGASSVVFDQAENRMHVQKALILKMMGLA